MPQDTERIRIINERCHELMREGKSFDEIANELLINPCNKKSHLNESLDVRGLRQERKKVQRKKNKKQ